MYFLRGRFYVLVLKVSEGGRERDFYCSLFFYRINDKNDLVMLFQLNTLFIYLYAPIINFYEEKRESRLTLPK